MSGSQAEIETEELAVDRGCLDGIELLEPGAGFADAIGDLLALQIHQAPSDEGDHDDENSGECTCDDAKEHESDDDWHDRARKSRVADLRRVPRQLEHRDEFTHTVRLL